MFLLRDASSLCWSSAACEDATPGRCAFGANLRRFKSMRRRGRWASVILCAGVIQSVDLSLPAKIHGAPVFEDGTIPPMSKNTANTFNIPAESGRIAGKNLYHTFRTIDLAANETA